MYRDPETCKNKSIYTAYRSGFFHVTNYNNIVYTSQDGARDKNYQNPNLKAEIVQCSYISEYYKVFSIAVASSKGTIFVYQLNNEADLQAKFESGSSPITALGLTTYAVIAASKDLAIRAWNLTTKQI